MERSLHVLIRYTTQCSEMTCSIFKNTNEHTPVTSADQGTLATTQLTFGRVTPAECVILMPQSDPSPRLGRAETAYQHYSVTPSRCKTLHCTHTQPAGKWIMPHHMPKTAPLDSRNKICVQADRPCCAHDKSLLPVLP